MVKSTKQTPKIIVERQIPEASKPEKSIFSNSASVGKKPQFQKKSPPNVVKMLEANTELLINKFERPSTPQLATEKNSTNELSEFNSEPASSDHELIESIDLNINPPFEANTCRAKLIDFIENGVCDIRVNDVISVDEYFFPIECELLDYKEEIPQDAVAIGKTIKHIVAMHNTFGGYLIFGVSETISEIEFKLVGCNSSTFDIKKLKDKLYSYTGTNINLSSWQKRAHNKDVIGLFVPKRLASEPVFFGKDGPQDNKNKPVFHKDEFYMRRGDNTEPASGSSVSFLFGERECFYSTGSLEKFSPEKKFTENNLPDRNFICPRFIGRIATIEKLWFWFADPFSYVKMLAGEGGLGKSSIAYEFAQQVCEEAPIGIQRVLWLTAKTRQFHADSDSFINVPWTHFDSYSTLLECLCRESAVSSAEIDGANERLLKSFLRDALAEIPTFIIIDDMDSLTAEDQRRGLGKH